MDGELGSKGMSAKGTKDEVKRPKGLLDLQFLTGRILSFLIFRDPD